MSELSQPHDRFFSKVFSRLETVEDILFNNFPLLANLLVPGSLEECREKFLDPELKKYYSDLLLKAKLKNGISVYIYLLLEHKSYHEPKVALALLRYILQIWENTDTIPKPFVFPVVIYHGKQKWGSSTDLTGLVELPIGLEHYVPQFQYYLYDLSQYSDDEIKGEIISRVTLLLFKHIYDEDFGERFIRICKLFHDWQDKKTALEFMRSVLEYIGNASGTVTLEQVREGVTTALSVEGEKLMPTLFEQLKKEGREEGREAGLVEGLLMGIQLTLDIKFGEAGLVLYQRIQNISDFNTLLSIKDALRNNAAIHEIEQLLPDNSASNP